MARYRVKRPVLFTTEGLLERTLPLFQRIFSLTSNVLPIRDDVVVVLRSDDTPLITLPLLHKLNRGKEIGKLPLLDSNLATQVYEPESSVLTMVRLPFVSSVNVLEVPRA
jgi:hypothetical protein